MRAYAVARIALLTLILSATASIPGFAREVDDPPPDAQSDVRVIFWVDEVFGSSYVAQVMLTNMTPDALTNWQLEFDLDPAADNIRSATFQQNGTRHIVRGAGWTRTIPAGSSVWFSIDGQLPPGAPSMASSVPLPTACVFGGEACTVEELEEPAPNQHDTLAVDVGWWVASQGVSEYRAQILLKNHTAMPVDHWTLRFQSNTLITDIEHGDWNRIGTNYEVTGRGWTKQIDPDETIWLTLRGVHYGQVDTLQACIFNGFPCTFVDPEEIVDAPEEPEVPDRLCSTLPDPDEDDASISSLRFDFSVESLWGDGFVYSMEVLNNSEKAVRDWSLQFTLNNQMNVTRMWNADWQKSGQVYTVTPLPHTSCIEPGESVQFGFEGTHEGGPVQPTGCGFNGNGCTFVRSSITTTAIEGDESGLTNPGDDFELEAPYPNPFTTEAKVPFRVAETQHVTVSLWNLQGQQVGVLFDGTAAAGQAYQISVPAGTLTSGIYMVRMTGATGIGVTKPVMLVR